MKFTSQPPIRTTALCRLCGREGPLRHSHIVPDFFLEGVEDEIPKGPTGGLQRTHILLSARAEIKSGRKQRGQYEKSLGIKEYLLCGDCEEQFGRYEGYARALFYGTAPGRIRKRMGLGTPVSFEPARSELRVDYVLMKLFVLSLLWRASVAAGEFFRGVVLDADEENILAATLRTEAPGSGEFYPFGMTDLRYSRQRSGGFHRGAGNRR